MTRAFLSAGLVGMLALAACSSTSPEAPQAPSAPNDVTSDAGQRAPDYPPGSLPAFLAAETRFSIFLTLLERDGFLLQRLLHSPERGFTLFVPTDDSFETLSQTTKAALEVDPSLITGIVERHFLPHRLASQDFVTGYVFTGMSRRASRLALVVEGARSWFGIAEVIESDHVVGRGVVHVIDGVNLGPTPDRIPVP